MSGPELKVRDFGVQRVEAHSHVGRGSGRRRREPTPSNRRLRNSNFFITISTNVKPRTAQEGSAIGSLLEQGTDRMFSEDVLPAFFRFLPPFEKDTYQANLKEIDVDKRVEIGSRPRGGRVHSHALMEVVHDSKIHLNYDAMRQWLRENVRHPRITGWHLDVQTIRGNRRAILDYIRKSDTSARASLPT